MEAFWVSFLPSEQRQVRRGGTHIFDLRYWFDALAGYVSRWDGRVGEGADRQPTACSSNKSATPAKGFRCSFPPKGRFPARQRRGRPNFANPLSIPVSWRNDPTFRALDVTWVYATE
jgi:hypothetical protein